MSASITNVEAAHIGHMGSEEAIADEKACLFAGMRPGAVAVLNRDNRHYERLVRHARNFGVEQIVGFGRHEAAEARLLACRLQDSGSDVEALIGDRRIEYRLGAAGEHWVLNSLAALAVAEALRRRPRRGPRRRWPRSRPRRDAARGGGSSSARGKIELLDESYNANPASMRAMLAVLARTEPAPGGRRLLAMGDMRELGEQADALSRRPGRRGRGERRGAGLPVRPAHGGAVAQLAAAQKGVHRPDSAALAGEVADSVEGGDVIAIKGSLGSKMKVVVDAVLAASGGETGR